MVNPNRGAVAAKRQPLWFSLAPRWPVVREFWCGSGASVVEDASRARSTPSPQGSFARHQAMVRAWILWSWSPADVTVRLITLRGPQVALIRAAPSRHRGMTCPRC